MEELPIELARSIFNLELQKDKIISNDKKTKRLCRCRLKMLTNYSAVCQQFFIRVTAKIIKFVTLHDIKNVSILDLRDWYIGVIYTKLYEDPTLSNKMILVFEKLQDSIDDNFFERFEPKFITVVTNITQPDFKVQIRELFEDISEWMENYLLNILSLKIDCTHISEEFLTANNMAENFHCEHSELGECMSMCSSCPAVEQGHERYYATEEIHLYINEDYDDGAFLSEYFELMHTYHKRTENIGIVFDFMLCDSKEFVLTDIHRDLIAFADKTFFSVSIINYDRISFGKYTSELKPYLK